MTDIDWKNRGALHGIKLACINFRRNGIGTDAVMQWNNLKTLSFNQEPTFELARVRSLHIKKKLTEA